MDLQQQGFDYTYDKRLYDRLHEGHARPVREHLHAGLDYQDKLARFLENHDEPRAAATFPQTSTRRSGNHVSFARDAVLSPGQFEGRRKHISPHLVRGPAKQRTRPSRRFYERFLSILGWPPVLGMEPGNCSNACRPGTATGPGMSYLIAFGWQSSRANRR